MHLNMFLNLEQLQVIEFLFVCCLAKKLFFNTTFKILSKHKSNNEIQTRFWFSQIALWFETRVFHFTNVFLIYNNVFLGSEIKKSFMLRRSFWIATMSFNIKIIAFGFNTYANYIHVYRNNYFLRARQKAEVWITWIIR